MKISFPFYFTILHLNKKTDVAVESILAPSDEQLFFRLNPASSAPRISFRNLESEPVSLLTIVYGTEGFPAKTYH